MFSCSVEKNTSLSRNFHNLTSHYNVYFNGEESFLRGVKSANTTIKNDYNHILKLFLYEDESVNSGVSGDMKRAIDKATKVITFHSITAKPKVKEGNQSPRDKAFFEKKEYNKWVDDSYMLMGKAYMFQGEFFLAVETFKHVLVTFPDEDIRFLAMTWLARAYIMIDEIREAERLLMALGDEPNFPEDYLEAYHTTRAQLHIRNKDYPAAAGHLQLALGSKGVKKEQKIRYTYILAQLYEEDGKNDLALEMYREVNRFNPPYEMAFNAKVSMAGVFESGGENSDELIKLLKKMLRDSKNKEYKDQIYFALGNIAFEKEDLDQAIEYYQLSVASSLQNRYQKGFSSLTLAEIYYNQPDYILSAAYYDSAVSFLSNEYPGYDRLAVRSMSLSGLVLNINSYQLEDSVQMLAGLPEAERLAIIDGIIEKVRQEEEEARLAEQQAMQDMAFNQTQIFSNTQQAGGPGGQTGGQWYFYNLNAKSFGQPEFRMKWGERTLEDNWRRKNKQTISSLTAGAGEEGDSVNGGAGPVIFDNKSREFYLVNIPLTDSAMEQSNLRLEDALYRMGTIYKENLLDYKESIKSFDELLDRYPGGRYTAPAMFYLYGLNNNIQKPEKAGYYKEQLLARYPDSHYSKLLNNPNYIMELEEEEKKVVRVYEKVFASYQQKDYTRVIIDADSAISQYADDPLVPKFKYIKSLAVGALYGKEEMKTGFDSLIAQHPATEESIEAQEIIDYMYMEFPEIKEAAQAQQAEEIYSEFNLEQEHYFLLALRAEENVNQVSFDMLNYNLDHFNQYDLDIERVKLVETYNMLAVKSFTDAEGAGRYLQIVADSSQVILGEIPSSQYRMMIISRDNFTILSREMEHIPYYLFYRKHYLNIE